MYETYSAVSSLLFTALLVLTSLNDNLPEMRILLTSFQGKKRKLSGKRVKGVPRDKDV
jgi:hypothetical protein